MANNNIDKSSIYQFLTSSSSEGSSKLKLSFEKYELQLNHVFTVATFSRTTTPVMIVKLEWEQFVGYGEAAMPPYLGESHKTASTFLSKLNLGQFSDPYLMDDILSYVDSVDEGNCAAKAAVDIALHDLVGKMLGKPWYQIWGYNRDKTPLTTYTIGIDKPEVVKSKVLEASPYKLLKIKVSKDSYKEMVRSVQATTDVPICVDANQSWTDRNEALDMCLWMKDRGVIFVEQPIDKSSISDIAWLTENSPLPIFADEGVQRLKDLEKLKGVYSGINIKLMKSTGMREGRKMLDVARALDMKVMVGCMTETSCAISAASHLSPMVDWADLDGNLLISNDPFDGVTVENGRVILNEKAGIGVVPKALV